MSQATTAAIERPIIFSGPMVRAILAGKKTQTRRVIHPDHSWVRYYAGDRKAAAEAFHRDTLAAEIWNCWRGGKGGVVPAGEPSHQWQCGDEKLPQNYQVGDRLWVREKWATVASLNEVPPVRFTSWPVWMAADESLHTIANTSRIKGDKGSSYGFLPEGDGIGRWRTPLHMPRWASRITLELVGVRVERLQDISESDAIAEGAEAFTDTATTSHRSGFIRRWCEINGKKHPWGSNPWVWVIEFKKLDAAGGQHA